MSMWPQPSSPFPFSRNDRGDAQGETFFLANNALPTITRSSTGNGGSSGEKCTIIFFSAVQVARAHGRSFSGRGLSGAPIECHAGNETGAIGGSGFEPRA